SGGAERQQGPGDRPPGLRAGDRLYRDGGLGPRTARVGGDPAGLPRDVAGFGSAAGSPAGATGAAAASAAAAAATAIGSLTPDWRTSFHAASTTACRRPAMGAPKSAPHSPKRSVPATRARRATAG